MIGDFLLFPEHTARVPWPSRPDDWFHCLCPKQGEVVYVEHRAIIALMVEKGEAVIEHPEALADGLPGWVRNFGPAYRDHGVAIGEAVARYLITARPPRTEGHVRAASFHWSKLQLRFGWFGGRTFVFLPRPELESVEVGATAGESAPKAV